ncbi:hypothetical protein ON010_g9853 [Phytophthora cinnamomi]|nr:hypothetical protein ON010_g9853 [Phytophthora cinnamomi]
MLRRHSQLPRKTLWAAVDSKSTLVKERQGDFIPEFFCSNAGLPTSRVSLMLRPVSDSMLHLQMDQATCSVEEVLPLSKSFEAEDSPTNKSSGRPSAPAAKILFL